MATFVEEFKDFKLLELSVSRHLSLAVELGRIVKQHSLTTISALEQSLACSNDHTTQIKELLRLIEDPNVYIFTVFFLFNRLLKKMQFVLLFYMLFIMRINLVRNYLLLFLL